jgi:hypothetical protein
MLWELAINYDLGSLEVIPAAPERSLHTHRRSVIHTYVRMDHLTQLKLDLLYYSSMSSRSESNRLRLLSPFVESYFFGNSEERGNECSTLLNKDVITVHSHDVQRVGWARYHWKHIVINIYFLIPVLCQDLIGDHL